MLRTTFAVVALAALPASLPAITQTPAQGGTLTAPIIAPTLTDDFNPFSNAQEDMVRGAMFEPVWIHNIMAREVHFRLAESFEYADDLSRWQFVCATGSPGRMARRAMPKMSSSRSRSGAKAPRSTRLVNGRTG